MLKELLEAASKWNPLITCTIVVAVMTLLLLVMLNPTAGIALINFLTSLSLLLDRFRHRSTVKNRE